MTNTKRHFKLVAYLLVVALVMTFSPQQCLADLYSGYLTVGGGGIYATDGWAETDIIDTKIAWKVTNYGTYYEYYYKFEVPRKALSHIIFEVSPSFTLADYLSPLPTGDFLNTYSSGGPGNSNPDIPGDIYGIKFDTTGNPTAWEVTFDTTRMPTWGDFYAKDGKDGGVDVYAYNTGFLADDIELNHIAVPDTVVPVPGAVLLGMLGMGVAGMKLRKFA